MTTKTIVKPRVDIGLLILRLGAGLSLLLLFGWPKLKDANQYLHTGSWLFVDFNRKVGLPLPVLVAVFQTLNESVGAVFAAVGFRTRLASGSVALGFIAATYFSVRMGEDAWLVAMFYAVMFATLALTGPGKLSIDYLMKTWAAKRMLSKSEDQNGQ